MNKFRNALLAALGLVVLNTVVVLYTTRTGRATSPVPVVQVTGTTTTTDVSDNQEVQFNLSPHSLGSNTNAAFFGPIPAGKRLVIDYYSSQAQDLTGGAAALTIGTVVNGSDVNYMVYVNKDDTNAVNQTVHICADPGTSVQAFAFNSPPLSGPSSCGATINISGHYIKYP